MMSELGSDRFKKAFLTEINIVKVGNKNILLVITHFPRYRPHRFEGGKMNKNKIKVL